VFHDAERALSAIAKFLAHLLLEGKARGKMGEVRKESKTRGGYGSTGNKNARKNSPKTQHIWHLGRRPLGATVACHTFYLHCTVAFIFILFYLIGVRLPRLY